MDYDHPHVITGSINLYTINQHVSTDFNTEMATGMANRNQPNMG